MVSENEGRTQSIGIDIQSVSEFGDSAGNLKSSAELAQTFTLTELAYCELQYDPLQSLAGTFAAKEAFFKTGASVLDWSAIEINHDENRRPCSPGFTLSISHSASFAIAVALPDRYFDPLTRSGHVTKKSDENVLADGCADTTNPGLSRRYLILLILSSCVFGSLSGFVIAKYFV